MMDILNTINSFVWGPPLMVLLIGTGILLTVRLGLLQVIKLPTALKLILLQEIQATAISIALKPCVRRWQLLLAQVIS